MAERREVIATRVGGVPEVVTDGENGLLVDVEDSDGLTYALKKLLRDDALRKAMGECGYRRVQHHHRWDDLARRYLAVFEAERN
jgi:glycosyltransferase involved in cell wall biosynthesis